MALPRQFSLASPPADAVSRVVWMGPTLLVASAWDGSVSLFDAAANARVSTVFRRGAVLDVAAVGGSTVVCGGLDMAVTQHDFASGATAVLGSHAGAVRCVEHAAARGVAVSGSWDKTLRLWDARAGGGGGGAAAAGAAALPERCYALALAGADTVIAATADQRVLFFDLRKFSAAAGETPPVSTRESSLKHQTRVVRAFPDATGFATGCVEGRVAIDYIDERHEGKFAFKVRRAAGRRGGDRLLPRGGIKPTPPPPPFSRPVISSSDSATARSCQMETRRFSP
jgi:cell cycle arrest protein BUB3